MEEDKISFTLANIKKIAKDAGVKINCKKFYNYYSSRNWLIKGKPVNNIKGLIINWYYNDLNKNRR